MRGEKSHWLQTSPVSWLGGNTSWRLPAAPPDWSNALQWTAN
jgi:hypothetical protein